LAEKLDFFKEIVDDFKDFFVEPFLLFSYVMK